MDRCSAITLVCAGVVTLAPAAIAAEANHTPPALTRTTRPAPSATDAAPTPLTRAAPQYPRLAQFEAVQGNVRVCFTVTARGTVENPRVESVPDSSIADIQIRHKIRHDFRTASLLAIRDWKFSPRRVDGRAVSTPHVCQTLQFRLR